MKVFPSYYEILDASFELGTEQSHDVVFPSLFEHAPGDELVLDPLLSITA